ncbi:unnamed protein product [Symbiodinium sp. KB8]|nr:unnamed protein product [Symbiodinium sp. KB8]
MPKVRDWTSKSEKCFALSLHAISNDELKKQLQNFVQELQESPAQKIRVSKVALNGLPGQPATWGNAWAKCGCSRSCGKSFRLDLTANDEGFKAVLLEQGAHPEAPPGAEADRARQDRAASVAHLCPLQAGAALRGAKEDARPMPSTKEIKKARRSFIASQAPKSQRQDDQVSAWIEYVKIRSVPALVQLEQSQASSTKEKFELKFTVAQLQNDSDPLFSLVRDCVVPEGCCVLVSDTMLACVAGVLKTGKQGSGLTLVTDWTYKLNKAGWGVGIFALTQKHDSRGLPATELVIAGYAVAPKEELGGMSACLASFIAFYASRGVHLLSVIRYVLMDGTTAGRNAAAKVLPTLKHRLDLRHVLEAIDRWGRSTNGDKEDALAIRSLVFFAASLPTIRLFDACWQTALRGFEQQGKAKTLKYLTEHILESSEDGDFWASGWASGLWNAPIPLASLRDMIKSLDNCHRAIMVQRGHVDGQDEGRVLFKATDPRIPCQNLLTADWIRPGRDEVGEQLCLAPVWRFLEYLPDNVAGSTLNREVPHLGEVQCVYVMPLKQYNLSIDYDCHHKFLALMTAHDAATFRTAASDLSLLKEGRVSLPRLRVLFADLAMALKLRSRFHGHVIVCTCSFFCMRGTCVHHLLTRWMEGDPAVRLAEVSEFTARDVPPTSEGAEDGSAAKKAKEQKEADAKKSKLDQGQAVLRQCKVAEDKLQGWRLAHLRQDAGALMRRAASDTGAYGFFFESHALLGYNQQYRRATDTGARSLLLFVQAADALPAFDTFQAADGSAAACFTFQAISVTISNRDVAPPPPQATVTEMFPSKVLDLVAVSYRAVWSYHFCRQSIRYQRCQVPQGAALAVTPQAVRVML